MNVHKGWIGAVSREQAETLVLEMYPEARIDRLYEKIKGMWSYEVVSASNNYEELEEYGVHDQPDEDSNAEDRIENST